jgi:hypothetical protein
MLFPLIIALVLGCAFCIVLWSRARATARRKAIRRYCDEHRFDFLDGHIPATLDISSSLKGLQSVSSAFTGNGLAQSIRLLRLLVAPRQEGLYAIGSGDTPSR